MVNSQWMGKYNSHWTILWYGCLKVQVFIWNNTLKCILMFEAEWLNMLYRILRAWMHTVIFFANPCELNCTGYSNICKYGILFNHGNRWLVGLIWARPEIKHTSCHYNPRLYPTVCKPDIPITCDLARAEVYQSPPEWISIPGVFNHSSLICKYGTSWGVRTVYKIVWSIL